ncbi:GNAT family N-acetyltransferase [Microbispora sp. RL4-1S]|uniref:GNAT family N-acetyltransferase n=1 Tax=Microbispora oryzae TaxID=2806554 RepID=A0A940WM87_9ACTN|nr:GNAT family N-acetyltransferase [Microbispora oryzae]MBP2708076.1 GNAT family N-acetyltransferase [Microbispora oryzae]
MNVRDLTLDDLDAVLDIRRRSFGPLASAQVDTWRRLVTPMLAEGRYLGVADGTRLVAAARINPCVQWWHGRAMPMGAIGSVTVAPEDRGRGIGRTLMAAVIERCTELGDAVSALYPATTPLYRSVGYEHAGGRLRISLPTEALRTLAAPGAGVKLRRLGPDDVPELMAVLDRVHSGSRASGPLGWPERTWRLWTDDEDDFCYLADDGYVIYRWSDGDIEVDNLVAGSEATARALWSVVGTASSIAARVTASVEPHDPVLWLLRERSRDEGVRDRWMFRLIDLPLAVARRGFPYGACLDTVIEVDDPQRPANSGAWRLRVADGACAAEPGAAGGTASRLGIGGLSALFAGVPTATLRRTGRLTGGSPETDDALDAAFGCEAYMLDYF